MDNSKDRKDSPLFGDGSCDAFRLFVNGSFDAFRFFGDGSCGVAMRAEQPFSTGNVAGGAFVWSFSRQKSEKKRAKTKKNHPEIAEKMTATVQSIRFFTCFARKTARFDARNSPILHGIETYSSDSEDVIRLAERRVRRVRGG